MRDWFICATAGLVVRRALTYALVVGPILVAINHGDAILHGDISGARLFKIALTLLVPYVVSTCSSVQAMLPLLRPNETVPVRRERQPLL